jgi:hypothetical protein
MGFQIFYTSGEQAQANDTRAPEYARSLDSDSKLAQQQFQVMAGRLVKNLRWAAMGERVKLLAAMDPVGKNVPQYVNGQQQAISIGHDLSLEPADAFAGIVTRAGHHPG